ncbi:Methyltransferase domain-containing protein [Sporobacter termitidis DSM 10068]|uniref:Methyltransferase domain-containing protein n=1 Tax=Sporobacter termitidis DSM 10068 TaxID=1123282 RepID=A0A1M5YXQ6_9FIRM|nr:class I SAM-dependent methyltransferase [Sporobacter termitidis]SHI16816.1 Methyltransferase domain-containing protein [Sporobacter termitidis DSM 10068]
MIESKSWDWSKNTEDRWLKPATDAYYLSERWKERGFKSFLDLGCGMGRHTLFFARRGFSADAVDLSEYAVHYVRDSAAAENLPVGVQQCDMLNLPFGDAGFDCVMAYNVIYHTDTAGFVAALSEITRVLKPGGELYITLISKNSQSFLNAAPEAYVDDNTVLRSDNPTEHNVPHFFVGGEDIGKYFTGYTLINPPVEQRFHDNDRGSSHFVILAEKKL